MKKIYLKLIGLTAGAILCLGLAMPAMAQRGGDHSDGKTTNGGGTSTPAPVQAPPQAQPQRSNPQPQVQRSAPQPRNDNYQQQRGNNVNIAPQRNNPNANGGQPQRGNLGFTPANRGGNRPNNLGFTPANRGGNVGVSPQRRYYGIGPRGNAVYAPNRYGSVNRNGYRSYPGLQFGRNHITARPQGFYYNNRGYYRSYYRPQLGVRINVLPFGYYPFYFGTDQYFYSEGLYYRQDNNDYTVVEPPVGAAIDKLPAKAQAIAINGMQYYELNGVYYQPITKDDGTLVYQIAGKDGELTTDDSGSAQDDLPQVGDLVDTLPEGCKALKLNGQKYYVSEEGYYFQDAVDTNGDKVFKIVGTPTDAPGN